MNILPGEPVPPGFEDEINRVAEIQSILAKYDANALIGIEYTVELYHDDEHERAYICLLCDKRGDSRNIISHWSSYNHRLKYLEKHFPTAIRELAPIRYKPDSRQVMSEQISNLAEAIEEHHGRLQLTVCNGDDFRRSRSNLVDEVNAMFHYDERNGPNFVNVINRSLIDPIDHQRMVKGEQTLQITIKAPKRINAEALAVRNSRNRDSLDSISSDSDSHSSAIKRSKRKSQSPAFKILPRVRRPSPHRHGEERSAELDKKKGNTSLPTPKELSIQASQIAQERYKWEKYRCMLDIYTKSANQKQKDYEKNPEKHPLYPDEWKKFWNRRYKELQSEKKVDPNKYDYKPEWIIFWTRRMMELFEEDLEKQKKEIKTKLGLPEDAEEKTDQLKEKYKVKVSRNPPSSSSSSSASSTTQKQSKGSSSVPKLKPTAFINISDDDDTVKISPQKSRVNSKHAPKRLSRNHSKSRSLSPLSDDYERRVPSSGSHHGKNYERRMVHSSRYPPHMPPTEYYHPSFHRSRYPEPPSHFPGHGGGYRVFDPYQYSKYDRGSSPASVSTKKDENNEPEPEDDGPLTVVAVLRLLTALEDHLGSLGPKVVDLLGKALALEKVKANSADDMLINEDYCVFFETIKEKLKGLLIADVLEDAHKIKAVKKAIKNIAAIVHQVNQKGKTLTTTETEAKNEDKTPDTNKKPLKTDQKPSIKDLPFDRQIVSSKLAAALVMQGRDDISTEDMDKLIYIFLLLVKLSKEQIDNDGESLQVKDVLIELGIASAERQASKAATSVLPTHLVEEMIENEVSALVSEVEDEISTEVDKDSNAQNSANALESLTDSDLQTLLQNFKHLSTEEQHHLIAHLKKLETDDPVRVEKLRKYVNASGSSVEACGSSVGNSVAALGGGGTSNNTGGGGDSKHTDSSVKSSQNNDYSPSRLEQSYSDDEKSQDRSNREHGSSYSKFIDEEEDEDDDYNVDEVLKVVSSNVKRINEESSRQSSRSSNEASSTKQRSQNHHHESKGTSNTSQRVTSTGPTPNSNPQSSALTFNHAGLNVSFTDTQNLIANLMGSLQQSSNQFTEKNNQQSKQQSGNNRILGNSTISTVINQQRQPNASQDITSISNISSNSVPFYQQQQMQHQQQQLQGYKQPTNVAPNSSVGYYNSNYNNMSSYPTFTNWPNGQMANMQSMPYNNAQNFMNPQMQPQQPQGYMFPGNK